MMRTRQSKQAGASSFLTCAAPSTLAPLSSSTRATSVCPFCAATNRLVAPLWAGCAGQAGQRCGGRGRIAAPTVGAKAASSKGELHLAFWAWACHLLRDTLAMIQRQTRGWPPLSARKMRAGRVSSPGSEPVHVQHGTLWGEKVASFCAVCGAL